MKRLLTAAILCTMLTACTRTVYVTVTPTPTPTPSATSAIAAASALPPSVTPTAATTPVTAALVTSVPPPAQPELNTATPPATSSRDVLARTLGGWYSSSESSETSLIAVIRTVTANNHSDSSRAAAVSQLTAQTAKDRALAAFIQQPQQSLTPYSSNPACENARLYIALSLLSVALDNEQQAAYESAWPNGNSRLSASTWASRAESAIQYMNQCVPNFFITR